MIEEQACIAELPTPTKGLIIVKFDYDRSQNAIRLDSGLFVPERFKIQDGDDDELTAYGVTTDRKLINPQIVDVLSGEYTGERAFVYYGAFEIAKWIDEKTAVIPENSLLFLTGPIRPVEGTYLGDEVFIEGPKTDSGIYLTPIAEEKYGVKIILSHVCENSPYKVGDAVITINSHQYDLNYDGKKYIKLRDRDIIAVENNGQVKPIGDWILVEHLTDPEEYKRIAENDRRKERRDFINKSFLHISTDFHQGIDPDLNDLPETKTVKAMVLGIGDKPTACVGDNVLIFRNYGCKLIDGNWLIDSETIIGVLECEQRKN